MSDWKRHKTQMTREEAEERAKRLMQEKKYAEALRVCRYMTDELHEWTSRIVDALEDMTLDAEQLRAENSGSSWYLLGEMYYRGRGGVEWDEEEAFRCYARAAERGHVYALYIQGVRLRDGHGVTRDEEEGVRLILRAAEAVCVAACCFGAKALMQGRGVARDRRRAAQLFLLADSRFDSQDHLRVLLGNYSLEAAPLGQWEPRWHALVPLPIHEAMRATMLLGKRMRLPHGVGLMIAQYVCTE